MFEPIIAGLFGAFCLGLVLVYRKDATSSVNSMGELLKVQQDTEAQRIRDICLSFERLNEATQARYKEFEARAFAVVQQAKEHEARIVQFLASTKQKPQKAQQPQPPQPEPIVRNGRLRHEPEYAAHEPNAEG